MTKRSKNRASRKKRDSRGVLPGHSGTSKLSASPGPPRFAEQILNFTLPRDKREETIGDLKEHYEKLSVKFSRRVLNFWYYKETTFLLAGHILRIGRLVIYGIEEIIRKFFT